MTHPSLDDDAPDPRLAALLAEAAALPELRPSRDLWPGIAERLDAAERAPEGLRASAAGPVAPSDPAGTRVLAFRTTAAVRPAIAPSRVRWLAAAVGLAMLSSAATYHFVRPAADTTPASTVASAARGAPAVTPAPPRDDTPDAARDVAARGAADRASRPEPRSHSQPRPAFRNVARSVDDAVPGAADYDREIGQLRAAVADHHGELDSATVAVLARNLQIIDAAIAASRAALARDPHSPFLGEQLTRALGQKVDLLRTAALLPRT